MPDDSRKDMPTRAVHGGEPRQKAEHALTNPIYPTSTYTFANTKALFDYMEGRVERMEYGRYGNPTVRVAEQKLAELDSAEDAVLFPSGMSAVTTALLALCKSGDHVIFTNDCYRRTRQFAGGFLARYGVETTLVAPDDFSAIESAVRPNTRVIFSESPTNPYNQVMDLPRLVEVARKHRIKTLIDSTFATPVNQRPVEFGIDLVIHSATKFLGGHNDLLAGAVAGKAGLVSLVRDLTHVIGNVSDPFSAYLLIRGLKTLPLRINQQNATALEMAHWLEKHPRVRKVYYAGLESHNTHKIAKEQMSGFGSVIAFEVEGDGPRVSKFVDALEIPYIAPSLGGVESLVEQPAYMSYFELTPEQRLEIGIKDNLVRYSVGLESWEDIRADLEGGFAALAG